MENMAIFVHCGLSDEQKETIHALFRHNELDMDEVNPRELTDTQSSENTADNTNDQEDIQCMNTWVKMDNCT